MSLAQNPPDEWYYGTVCIKSCPCTGERNVIVPLYFSTGDSHASVRAGSE